MARLAIKGNTTRGKEVIEILEMLGGKNSMKFNGNDVDVAYYITTEGTIDMLLGLDTISNYIFFTLEEFLEKYPYKVGDTVHVENYKGVWKIVELLWRESLNTIYYGICNNKTKEFVIVKEIKLYKEKKTFPPYMDYDIKATKEQETMEEPKELLIGFTKDNEGNWILNTHKDYEIKEVDGKFKLVKKQPKYPKTYDKCCDILGVEDRENGYCGYEYELLGKFQKLFICRNAYWKIAGEELGLNKPWKPDFDNEYYLIGNECGEVYKYNKIAGCNAILTFPTEEMRDAFYENFKDLIEECKELL